MTCDHCAQTIAKKFSGNEGIILKDINYPSGTGKFEYGPEKISKEKLQWHYMETIGKTTYLDLSKNTKVICSIKSR